MNIVQVDNNKKYIKMFLQLPKRIYKQEMCPQDISLEKQILQGNHVLSKYFKIKALLLLEGKEVKARCVVTIYHNSSIAYVGFFECENDIEYAKKILKETEEYCKSKGIKEIIGPVNASFWLGYRFKADSFDEMYTNEPYNKSYYTKFFELCEYNIYQEYQSNSLGVIPKDYINETYDKVLNKVKRNGYIIRSPKPKEFLDTLKIIYKAMTDLYKDFPTFHYIEEEDFIALFYKLRFVIDYDMVKMAYKEGVARGFFICIPNYKDNTSGRLSIGKLIKILRIKQSPKEYVNLYLGAYDPGIGTALVEEIALVLREKATTSIGALIMEGKICNKYYEKFSVNSKKYLLYKKVLICDKY